MILEYKSISFKDIIKDVSFGVSKGEVIELDGVSGSGKTTIFRLATKLLYPESGNILYDGLDIKDINSQTLRSSIRYIQSKLSLPFDTIMDNIYITKTYNPNREFFDDNTLREFMKFFGIDSDMKVSNLSMGEIQRVSLLMGIFDKPNILLLDEPISNNDIENSLKISKFIEIISSIHQISIIFTTHQKDIIKSDRKLSIMNKRVIDAS
jgi:ATP-binding cassette subfamily B protein